ncbi:hypothetical protein AVEN_101280-1 [Araneus ventricosus]|uniref:Endonuclease/exonuclease/phosphatase domain-containing protein n=1 Tax=Araneus ventricosus TaxID=182803 RepID=A0A4Y2EQZ8_ARAVE|nr:hypothetical protein AVEN_101280-1 [Araneus ventricosus]
MNIIAPEIPTRFDPRGSTIIDLAVTRHFNYASTANSENELSSDHLPVRYWLDTNTITYTHKIFVPNFKKYQEAIIQNPTTQFNPQSGADIEEEVKRFTTEHLQAFNTTGKWVNKRKEECSAEIKQQTKIRNKLKKIAQLSQDPRDKNLYNRAQNYLRKLHAEASQKRLSDIFENLNPTDGTSGSMPKRYLKLISECPLS